MCLRCNNDRRPPRHLLLSTHQPAARKIESPGNTNSTSFNMYATYKTYITRVYIYMHIYGEKCTHT